MKTFLYNDVSPGKIGRSEPAPVRICMHVRGPLRTDARVRREASALVQEGFAVTVVDVEREPSATLEEDLDAIQVRHLAKPSWFIRTRMPWRLVKSAEKFLSCTLALLKVRADIYHAHDENTLLACYLVAKLRRKPLIFDAHEMLLRDLDRVPWRWLRNLLCNLMTTLLKGCAGVITVSPPIAREISARYHAPEVSLILNVPAYQKVAKNDRLRQRLNLGPTARIALYQGNLQPDRTLDRLICAAKFLAPDTVIVLMGKAVGDTQMKLEALIASEGVTDRVKILPAVPYEELLGWTSSADMGLIILDPDFSFSIRMCLPNKLFEYLMAGLPVLATQLDAVAEILKTHDVGQIVPSLAPGEIAAALNAMLADTTALARMHRNTLEIARSEFCWEKEHQQLIRLYHRVLTHSNKENDHDN